ncbi:class I SAM-dependent methyltransferase [Mycolicibacterium baixiangningiae]|uniref:class I SAM-dependent methyltransferase n=1 Tax=Mycolicibacterium baixiangningiae TaxID=2761578 RepID=UPI0018681995|nr:class I SAM-dependent methyltransferase [Mycolicibacterium baixiangningiae]
MLSVDGLTPIERTALLTLYARARESRRSPAILTDSEAGGLVERLEYDFDALQVSASVRCPVALRTKMLDARVRTFISEHRNAVVVDLGAGLDHRIMRVRPPATVDWFNVDLPGISALRAAGLAALATEHAIVARIDGPAWADTIPADRPAILVADGLTGFLSESIIIRLLRSVTDHFQSGEIVFNDYGRVGWMSRTAMRLAPQGSVKAFGPNWSNAGFADAHRPETWNPRLTLVEETSLFFADEVALFPLHLRVTARIAGHVPALARRARILRYQF